MTPNRFAVSLILALLGSLSTAGTAPPLSTAVPAVGEQEAEQYVLGAAHVPGLNQTAWRTSLEVCNFGVARDVRLDLLLRDQANLTPPSVLFQFPIGLCTRFDDAVSSLFGLEEGAGAIRVACDGDGCLALGRTYNDAAAGTFGSAEPALAAGEAITEGQTAVLVHLTESGGEGSGYRTNLELLNVTSAPLTVQVELLRASASPLGTLAVDLDPYEVKQLTRVFRQVTTAVVFDGYALLRTMTPGGAFLAGASMVDNGSGDATTVTAKRIGSELPALEPITAANASRVRALRALRIPDYRTAAISQCSVEFSPDGSLLAGVCGFSSAPVWDVASGRVLYRLLPSAPHVVATAFHPNGEVLATGELSGRVAMWDTASGELTRELPVPPAAVWELAFSPTGDTIALATVNYNACSDPACGPGMHLWDVARGEQLWSYPADREMMTLAVGYAPGGDAIAFGTAFDGLYVLSSGSGQPLLEYAVAAPVADVAYSPDGQLLAAASDDTTIRLFGTSDYQLQGTLEGHTHYVNGIAFSPDGSLLVSGSHDRTLGIWDLASGQRLVTLAGHDQPVLRVAVNRSGTLIASISWDGTVRLWGVVAGEGAQR